MIDLKDILFIVHSHRIYSAALSKCLESFLPLVDNRQVFISVAGSTIFREDVSLMELEINGPHYILMNHESYDFNGLIWIVNQTLPYTHVFCIQDTMTVGTKFPNLVTQADENADATAAYGGQCNLVLWKIDYLKSRAHELERFKNCSKQFSIDHERWLWYSAPNRASYPNSGIIEDRTLYYPYGTTPRIKEYYPALDIWKYKANYGQNTGNYYTTP